MSKPKHKDVVSDTTSTTAAILRQGLQSQFWLELKKILEANIAYLDTTILEDDSLSEPIELTQRDFVRKWRLQLKELLDMPEKVAAHIETSNINLDPFKRVLKGIIPDETKRTG